MSKLSTWFHQVADFVTGAVAQAPADQQTTVANVAQILKGAATAIEQALPTLAKLVVDTGLGAVGYGKYIPDMNSFIDLVIAELQSRKTAGPTTQPPTA